MFRRHLPEALLLLPVLAACYALYDYLVGNVIWDVLGHARIILVFLEHGTFPVPPGYALMVWMFAGFSRNISALLDASAVVLALMTVLKLGVIWFALTQVWSRVNPLQPPARRRILSFGLSLALMLVAPLYTLGEHFYFGRIGLSIWHNPTTIAVTPFALLLFFATPAFVEQPGRHGWRILLLGLANLVFKPSFLFAYIPGVFLYGLFTGRSRRDLLRILLPLLGLGLLILGQYLLIYASGTLDELIYKTRPVGILLRPLRVWNYWLEWGQISFWASLLVSLAFPLLFLALYGPLGKVWPLTWLGLIILGMGLMVAWMLAEGGPRLLDGNFLWTPFLANLAFFVAAFLNLLSLRVPGKGFSRKEWVLYALLALHVLSGILYLLNLSLAKNFH